MIRAKSGQSDRRSRKKRIGPVFPQQAVNRTGVPATSGQSGPVFQQKAVSRTGVPARSGSDRCSRKKRMGPVLPQKAVNRTGVPAESSKSDGFFAPKAVNRLTHQHSLLTPIRSRTPLTRSLHLLLHCFHSPRHPLPFFSLTPVTYTKKMRLTNPFLAEAGRWVGGWVGGWVFSQVPNSELDKILLDPELQNAKP